MSDQQTQTIRVTFARAAAYCTARAIETGVTCPKTLTADLEIASLTPDSRRLLLSPYVGATYPATIGPIGYDSSGALTGSTWGFASEAIAHDGETLPSAVLDAELARIATVLARVREAKDLSRAAAQAACDALISGLTGLRVVLLDIEAGLRPLGGTSRLPHTGSPRGARQRD
jgi:hypothetical protein